MAVVHFSLGKLVAATLMVGLRGRAKPGLEAACAAAGGTMELKMRLNVLAAIVSFGFLAAIVFGMV